jgi:hypothetical protein
MMINDRPHSAMRARVGGGEGPLTRVGGRGRPHTKNAPHTKNCDTVRLAIRLRSRRISCSFGLSRLAEKAGSSRDCPARCEKSHLPHMSRPARHAGRVLIRLPPRIGYNASVVRPQAQRLFPPARPRSRQPRARQLRTLQQRLSRRSGARSQASSAVRNSCRERWTWSHRATRLTVRQPSRVTVTSANAPGR